MSSEPHQDPAGDERLVSARHTDEDVEIDREEAIFAARMYGWAFRTVDLARRRAFDAVRIGVQTVTKAVEKLNYLLEPVERRRIIRLARARDALLRRNDLDRLADKADQWGMELEAQQLRRAISELRYSFDPILCFEVADRPVYPADLNGSMYALLGIDPDGPMPNPRGLDVKVMPASNKGDGRLTEIT